jgi:hypothetical protein
MSYHVRKQQIPFYILIGSSRPGGMPANLQGLWTWQMSALWNTDSLNQ